MAKIRVGFGSDFNITGQKVGFGTTNPTALLEVAETAKADFNITGVTTLTSYGGFVAQNQRITEPTTIKRTTSKSGTLDSVNEREIEFTELGGVHHGDDQYFNTLSEDLVIEEGKILSIHNTEMVGITTIGEQDRHTHASHVSLGSLEQVSVTGHFSVPNGGINERQETPIEGTVRFNDDLNTLEFFNGVEWKQFTYNQGQSGRVVFVGGNVAGSQNAPVSRTIDYLNLSTLGNSIYFGDIASPLNPRRQTGGCSSSTRGIFMGGQGPSGNLNEIGYLTIASQGNAVDFGNLLAARQTCQTLSSSTRGISYGAGEPAVNVIEYVEISTTGNSINFGESTKLRRDGFSLASSTRGISGGGTGGTNAESSIEYLTIASLGDGIEFGNLIQRGRGQRSFSNSVRGIINGGYDSASPYARSSRIQYITIASTGNASYFGELTATIAGGSSGTQSNHIRGVFAGGTTPTAVNNIDYVTIASTGNALDFGDLSAESWSQSGACSDSHGGLGGF